MLFFVCASIITVFEIRKKKRFERKKKTDINNTMDEKDEQMIYIMYNDW